jgi:2-C-methyl-D-erythritol 4-phosphate cytidylyltransferase
MNIAILLAGGQGRRFNENHLKQLHTLGGLPILFYPLRTLDLAPEVGEIIIAANRSALSEIEDIARTTIQRTSWRMVDGGETRNHSVRNALDTISDESATILVHDGVRPLLSLDLIARTVDAMRSGVDAVLPVIRQSDLIAEIDGDRVLRLLDRNCLRRGQTPQVFPARVLKQAFAAASDDELRQVTSVYEVLQLRDGEPRIVTVEGDERNIKVTFPLDRSIAQHLLTTLD